MARLTQTLKLSTERGDSFNFNVSEEYNEVFSFRREVNNSDGFVTLITPSTSITEDASGGELSEVKCLAIKNFGLVGAEVQFKITSYSDSSNVDDYGAVENISFLLGAGEYIYLPNSRWVGYNADNSGANAKPTTSGAYLTIDTNEYADSGANVDSATEDGVVNSNSATTVYLEPYTSAVNCAANLFHVGDLIRIRDEVMEVTAIGNKSNLANNTLTVIRGAHGSTKVTAAADGDAVRLPFFNAYHNFTAATGGYDTAQTNKSGKFKAMNFFGYGRVEDSTSSGIVPGSVAGKFYKAGYQELGMSGISGSSNSGLTASTQYEFDITVDGGSAFTARFTTDASNLNFGGKSGILAKIQDVLDAEYYTSSSNLFEKKVLVELVGGDIRFTSGQRLSTSAIALATTSGTTATDLWAAGRFPTLAKLDTAVAARLPEDTRIALNGVSTPNRAAFFYDDGHGNIRGTATGRINYETGEIDFTGPSNAHFTITANYDSAHGGGINTGSNVQNVISEVSARSCNSKVNVPIQIVAFN